APAGNRAHGRRPEDQRAQPLEPDARCAEPLRGGRQFVRDIRGRQPDLDDRGARAACRGPHGRDALRSAGATVSVSTTVEATKHVLTDAEWSAFQQAADALIPEAHGMPSARTVVTGSRLTFVLGARPDLLQPLKHALQPGLGDDPQARFAALERDDPTALS